MPSGTRRRPTCPEACVRAAPPPALRPRCPVGPTRCEARCRRGAGTRMARRCRVAGPDDPGAAAGGATALAACAVHRPAAWRRWPSRRAGGVGPRPGRQAAADGGAAVRGGGLRHGRLRRQRATVARTGVPGHRRCGRRAGSACAVGAVRRGSPSGERRRRAVRRLPCRGGPVGRRGRAGWPGPVGRSGSGRGAGSGVGGVGRGRVECGSGRGCRPRPTVRWRPGAAGSVRCGGRR